MSLASPYQEHYYVADGVTTSFSFGEYFTGLSQAYVKCIIYFDDGTNCVPTFTVDMTTGFITIVTLTKPDGTVLTVPPAGSIVRVFRDTPEQQNVTASQLQNYTAKQLERIFDSVVAMIQEVSYSDLHKTIRLTETQRDVSMEQLKEENDQAILYWDFETRQLKATDYGQNQVVKSDTVDRLVYLQPEGKIYFIPKGSNNPIAIGSATIHNDLGGRNAPDCHPESAITGLREHLQELQDKDIEIEEDVQIALNRSQEAKDTADEAKETAEYAQNIADEAKDIAEDAKDVAEGIDEKAQTALDNSEEALDKVTQEISDRQDADDALQDQITDNKDAIEDHIADTNNPHQVTKAQVGLGNVDNTSDLDKPISTATQSALDLKMPISTKYGASISLTIDSSTYVLTAQLKDQDNNNLGTAQTIDLPLESVVVSGSYDSDTKEVILVLENGSEIRFSVADLISGLQSEITAQNPLNADLVNDSTSAHKFVTATEKTNWNNHIANTNNPHEVTKTQVGLGNVDNTSDLNKPISTATQSALDGKVDKNAAISGATHTKITYDSKGLVTDGADITLSDVTDVTASAAEVNVLDGITATTTELNYVDGVTSNIQTQLNAKAVDTDVVHKTGNETISGTKTFNETLQLKSNLSFRSYGSSDSGRLQFRAQPSDNVIRGTVAITDGYSTAGSGYNGFVAQMVARAGSTTSDPFNTIRVSNKGVEYIQEANDGTITGQYIIVDNYGLIPSARLAASGSVGQVLTKTTTGQDWETLATVATTGSYSDLSGTPTIGNATLTIQKNSVAVDTFTANATVDKSINITVPVSAADVNALPDSTKYVANASMTINNTTYVVTLQLKDQDGNNIGTAQTIDLPLESVVVGGSYDSTNKKIVLTLKDGSTIDIPVGDLVAGLQTEITSTNKLDADLVDDSTSTNKFVTASDKTTWNGKQDAISDLATIRSNASSGASAYTTIQGYGDIVTHSASEFATSAQGAKADTAVQPSDLGNGTITITQGGETKGSFTTNQDTDTTIEIDAGGDKSLKSIDAEVVGTLNISENGDVSGFSPSDYLVLPVSLYMTDASSFEIGVCFTTPSTIATGLHILANPNSSFEHQIRIEIDYNGKPHIVIHSGTNNQSITGVTTLQKSTKYYIKLVYDGTNYTLLLSTDGTTYTTEATAVATYLPGTCSNPYVACDVDYIKAHMQNWYIKKNGILTYRGLAEPSLHQRASAKHEVIEFQQPTAANGYKWYRKYADGWVEQGGIVRVAETRSLNSTISLPITMSNNNYTISATAHSPARATYLSWAVMVTVANPTTTTFDYQSYGFSYTDLTDGIDWQVSGIAAN